MNRKNIEKIFFTSIAFFLLSFSFSYADIVVKGIGVPQITNNNKTMVFDCPYFDDENGNLYYGCSQGIISDSQNQTFECNENNGVSYTCNNELGGIYEGNGEYNVWNNDFNCNDFTTCSSLYGLQKVSILYNGNTYNYVNSSVLPIFDTIQSMIAYVLDIVTDNLFNIVMISIMLSILYFLVRTIKVGLKKQ